MKVHEIKGFIQSTFLIEEDQGLLLLDSGCYCDYLTILKMINSFPSKKLLVIALSHNHPDHCGGSEALRKNTKCKVYGPKNIGLWYQGLTGSITYIIDIILTYYVAYRLRRNILRQVFFQSKVRAEAFSSEDFKLPEFPSWSALKTPGHTPLDTCFFHEASRTLYIGDLLILNRGKLIRPYPIYEPSNYVLSLKKILELRPKKLLMAHGGIYDVTEKFPQQIETICKFTSQTPRTHHFLFKIFLKRFFKI